MAGTDAEWPPDVEFVEYVQARQHTLLRAAYLVSGDLSLAESLLRGALVSLAREWDRVREDRPDVHVRRILYRAAVSSWRTRTHDVVDPPPSPSLPGDFGDAHPGNETPWDANPWDAEEAERRLDVLRALDALAPRQRAVVVLRFFDDRDERDTAEILGCSVGTVRSETQDALARLRTALPAVDLGMGSPR